MHHHMYIYGHRWPVTKRIYDATLHLPRQFAGYRILGNVDTALLATLEVGDIGGGCLARAGLEPTTSSTIAQ